VRTQVEDPERDVRFENLKFFGILVKKIAVSEQQITH
jgi:hypothetical protein